MKSLEKDQEANKLSEYLSFNRRSLVYGVTETGISLLSMAGSTWSMYNVNTTGSGDITVGVYAFVTSAAFAFGFLGTVDGFLKVRYAVETIEAVEDQAKRMKFRLRGFFFNRTVAAT